MPIDTVKLKSPPLSEAQISAVEQACMKRQGINLATGEIQYELTTGSLEGTWDSKVSIRIMKEQWISGDNSPRLAPCQPYLLIEGSVHKAMLGHNIFCGPTNFREAVFWFIADIANRLSIDLPNPEFWFVRRVDWAEIYLLHSSAITQFFRGIRNCTFPRRKPRRYGLETIFIPGTTTSVKMYHKGPEFKKHDYKKLKHIIPDRVDTLVNIAYSILRVEIGIQPKKLDSDFGRMPKTVDVDEQYLKAIHDSEINKLIRETKSDMTIVRNNEAVHIRLSDCYRPSTARNLFGFWMQLATLGEEVVKDRMPSSSFYRYRKQLIDAGVSWNNTDINVTSDNIDVLPVDFKPVRTDPRYCSDSMEEPDILRLIDFNKYG